MLFSNGESAPSAATLILDKYFGINDYTFFKSVNKMSFRKYETIGQSSSYLHFDKSFIEKNDLQLEDFSLLQNNHQEYLREAEHVRNLTNENRDQSNVRIWRPFTPPNELCKDMNPHSQQEEIYKIDRKKYFKIKPSLVKFEASESSVFKAVQKTCSKDSSSTKPFICSFSNCHKCFSRHEELTRHTRIHSGMKPYQCMECGKCFGRKDHLRKHLKTHLSATEKKIHLCVSCGHRYTRSDALARHRRTAHASKK